MSIEKLYLDDIRILDIFAKSIKNEEDFIYTLKIILKTKNTSLETDNIEELKKVNNILCLDNDGCIHALLLNLFLRNDKNSIKEYIKEKINLTDINYLNNELHNEIKGNLSIDRALLDDVMKVYYNSINNEFNINEEDVQYIQQINQYYKDEKTRIQQIADSISSDLRKVGL